MQTKRCDELAVRAREYERSSKRQYHAEGGGETEVWYATIHKHLEEILLPEIKQHAGELFVEYWSARFVVDREYDLGQGVATQTLYNYEYGSHGTGYVCVTSRNVYLVVLDELTKLFPLTKPSLTGFLLNALSKQINLLRPFQGDHSRMLAPGQIQAASLSSGRNETERIKLVTTAGTWELFEHFTDQRKEMLDAIECLRSSAFDALRPKWHVAKRPPILSEAELVRRVRNAPSFSLLPATPDATRAERGARLLDLHHLAAEVARQGGVEVELDLAHAAAASPDNPQLRELRRAFAAMRHLLDRCTTEVEILDTLHIRIDRIPELADIYRKSVDRLSRPYFKSWHPLPDRPHPALERTIEIGDLHNPTGFGDAKFSLIWGHDGNTLFTGGNDGIVRIWDIPSSTVVSSFEAFTPEVGDRPYVVWIQELILSPDKKTLLTVSCGGKIKAWNTGNWSLRFSIDAGEAINGCAFNASGTYFGYNLHRSNEIRIYDTGTGRRTPNVPNFGAMTLNQDDEVISFSWGPSGDWMVFKIAEDGSWANRIVGINIESGEELFAIRCFDIHDYQISPTGSYIVVRGGARNDLRFWDVAAGDWKYTIDGINVGGWAFSPSGKYVVWGHDGGSIAVHETHTGALLYDFIGHLGPIRRFQFSQNEQFLMSCDDKNRLKLWGLAKSNTSFDPPKYFILAGEDTQRARSCAICNVISVDSTVIVLNARHDAAILDSSSGKISARHIDTTGAMWVKDMRLNELQYVGIDRCAVSPDGKQILLADNGGWAVFDSKKLMVLHSAQGKFDLQGACAVSADHRWVALSVDKELIVLDILTGKVETLSANVMIQSCAFDPRSQWLVFTSGNFVSDNSEIKMLVLDTGGVRPFDNPLVVSKWFPSGRPALNNWGHILDCAVNSDGSLVFAVHRFGVVSVWDASSLGLVNYWQAHNTGFPPRMACKPMPDNKTVLTVGSDGAVKLWEIATGKCLSTIQTEGILEDCDCFPDGRRVVAAGEAGVYWLEVIGA